MAFEMSLLEVLALAEKGMKDDTAAKEAVVEAAQKLITPADPQRFSFQDIRAKYRVYQGTNYEVMRQLPRERFFIFDVLSHFFMQHGGYELMDREDWESSAHFLPKQDSQLIDRHETVLFNQPNQSLTSIVVGRTPAWLLKERLGRFGVTEPVTPPQVIKDSVYIYVEAGKANAPGMALVVNGRVPVSSDLPILYFSIPFPEGAPIRARGIEAQVRFLVPTTNAYR